MKKLYAVLILLLVADIGVHLWQPAHVSAQSSTGVVEGIFVASSVTGCQWLSGATVTNGVALCFVNTGTSATSGLYFALNGSNLFSPLSATASVTFNGRAGSTIVLTKADVLGTGVTISNKVIDTAPVVTSTLQ